MSARFPSRIKSLIHSAIGGGNFFPDLLTWLLATAGTALLALQESAFLALCSALVCGPLYAAALWRGRRP